MPAWQSNFQGNRLYKTRDVCRHRECQCFAGSIWANYNFTLPCPPPPPPVVVLIQTPCSVGVVAYKNGSYVRLSPHLSWSHHLSLIPPPPPILPNTGIMILTPRMLLYCFGEVLQNLPQARIWSFHSCRYGPSACLSEAFAWPVCFYSSVCREMVSLC